jgi:WD40 repeat protein
MTGGARTWIVLGLALAAAAPSAAAAPGPPMQPFLRIEAGMHTAMINRIAVDRAGKKLVTASDDKTARVWDLATGRLLRVLRPPIGDGHEGKVFAVALSPDGRTAAVGGWTGYDWSGSNGIYLFDVETGELRRTIRGFPDVIVHLAYSFDGSLIAAAMGGANGVRVFRARDGALVMQDLDYKDYTYWVEFDRKGRLVTSSYDGNVRLYDADLQLVARRKVPGGKRPAAARFSPNGRLVAVGFDDVMKAAVVDGSHLAFRYAPECTGSEGVGLNALAWSPDGQRLYGGGGSPVEGRVALYAWSSAGKGPRQQIGQADSTIMDIRTIPNRDVVFGAADPRWALLSSVGKIRVERTMELPSHENGSDLRVSASSARVAFRFQRSAGSGAEPPRSGAFDVDRLRLTLERPGTDPTLAGPVTEGLAIDRWKNDENATLAGRPLPLLPHETSCSLAIAPGGRSFLLGTTGALRLFDREGKVIWLVLPPSIPWGVNLSKDGRFAVAALGDGSIRWYEIGSGQERLALVVHQDGRRWIAWTPEGFFAASPGAEAMAGFHLNQGSDRAGEFVALDQLADLLHRPDLVSQALSPAGQKKIVEALASIGDARAVLAGGRPPAVEIVDQRRDGDQVVLRVKVTDRGGGVGKLVFRVNGVVQEARSEIPSVSGQEPVTVRLRVPEGENKVSAAGYNGPGKIESRPHEISVSIPKHAGRRPTLHILAIGVTDYRDHALHLEHARDDARAIAAALTAHGQRLFDHVNAPEPLVDRDVTFEKLKARFDALAPQVKADDVFVFYAAGHGTVRNGRYLLVPADFVYRNDDSLRQGAIDEEKLRVLLAKIPAQKTLVLLDTCSAGAFGPKEVLASRGGFEEKSALDRLMKATGRAFLAASGSGEMALEGYQGHGVFTAALLNGLGTPGDTNGDGFIDIFELAAFIEGEVPRITRELFHNEQFPQSRLDVTGKFPIGTTK